jgi:uncharacterized protein YndB with AHSA1/START domain
MAAENSQPDTISEASRVQRELVIPAAVEEVWEIVTGDGWLADHVVLDLAPGGDARFTSRDSARTGWVEEVDPPGGSDRAARLIFWWEDGRQEASRVELILEPEREDSTRLRVTETRPLEVLDLTGIPLPGSGSASHGPAMLAVA